MFDYLEFLFLNPEEEAKLRKELNKIIDQSKKFILEKNESFIKLEILYEATIDELNDFMGKQVVINGDLNIPIKMLYMTNQNLLEAKLKKQEIYIIKNENYLYYISKNNAELKISEQKTENNEIQEVVLEITSCGYSVTKYIHDLNHSTKFNKWYPCSKTLQTFTLTKKEALLLIQDLLDNINHIYKIKNIYKIIDIYKVCNKTNLVLSENYNPIISDDILTLSWRYKSNKDDVNTSKDETFDIILNETREVIGGISFDYACFSGFTYGGNVAYDIKEQFRNNHYATRALKLLKELLHQNKYTGDKDLYISTLPENIYSKKVALNNDGEQVYSGDVPENDMLYIVDGIKKVDVYRIRIK